MKFDIDLTSNRDRFRRDSIRHRIDVESRNLLNFSLKTGNLQKKYLQNHAEFRVAV